MKLFDFTNDIWTIGDAFEILPTLSPLSVDLVLTDPPYDLNDRQKDVLLSEFLRIGRQGAIVFFPPENQFPNPDQFGFWVKPISTKNTSRSYSRFVEMIGFYRTGTWNVGRHWSQYTNVFVDLVDDTSVHNYRKPPSLIERLVRNHTNPGDLILDPFAGSGVVRDVGLRLGRKVLSIERDPDRAPGPKEEPLPQVTE